MVGTKGSRSQQIRSSLKHPIVDADGHMLELTPVLSDYVYQVGGADARDLFDKSMEGAAETGNAALENGKTWFEMTLEEKKEEWAPALPWWAMPTRSALDRATATVPRVLNDRMDELGMDYAVLYTTTGLAFDRIEPQEQRLIVCPGDKRLCSGPIPAVFIPDDARRHSAHGHAGDSHPGDGIRGQRTGAEGDNAAGPRGAADSQVPRTSTRAPRKYVRKMDVIGLDSDYDYDPFWKRCQELKIVPASHGSDAGWGAVSVYQLRF